MISAIDMTVSKLGTRVDLKTNNNKNDISTNLEQRIKIKVTKGDINLQRNTLYLFMLTRDNCFGR